MKYPNLMDLYTDFLMSSPNIVSATTVAQVLNNEYSHDSITRMLAQPAIDQKQYWKFIKPIVRQVESEEGVISVDDFIEHKPHSTENLAISWHFDHTSGKSEKGINIVSFTYNNTYGDVVVKLPIGFEHISKDLIVSKLVKKQGRFIQKPTRQASIGKNDILRSRLKILTHQNNIKYRYICFDTWYSSAETMVFIVNDLKKDFVAAIRDNRLISFDVDKPSKQQQWLSLSGAEIEPNQPYRIKLKKVDFELILVKEVFHNLNGSVGVRYLVSSDKELNAADCGAVYKRRWSSEEVHRSAKQNTALEKMPAKMERSQTNHIFASMVAVAKLECLKITTKTNHYTLKRNILIQSLKVAWKQIQELKELCSEKFITLPNFDTA